MRFVYGTIGPERFQVSLQQLFAEGFRIAGASLPEEGGHVVVNRTATAALKVNEPGLTVHQHHVAGVEIPVHEGVGILRQELRPEAVEIILQPDFVKL